jgi:adenylyltransferase/sulfurtransferase
MRYDRQESFRMIGRRGQGILSRSTIAIVGVGGIGSVAAEIMARAGAGRIALIDHDVVKINNLQRQSLYEEKDVGKKKAIRAAERIFKINGEVGVQAVDEKLGEHNLHILDDATIILDGTDNLETRFLINKYCLDMKKPWVHAAAAGETGYVFPVIPGGPCLKCIIKDAAKETKTSANSGILNTLVHAIAALQCNEAIKVIVGEPPEKNLLFLNIWENKLEKIAIKKDAKCPACASK